MIIPYVGIVESACVIGMLIQFRKQFPVRIRSLLISLAFADGICVLAGGMMSGLSYLYHRWLFGSIGKIPNTSVKTVASVILPHANIDKRMTKTEILINKF